MPEIAISPVSSSDEILVVESLAYEIWSEYYPPIIGQLQVDYMLKNFQSVDAITRQIKEGYCYFLVKLNHESIGYCGTISEKNKGELFISKFYLKKASRGKGFGKKIFGFVDAIARKEGLRKISLMVCKKNVNSIAAYERMGFKSAGPIYKAIGGGFYMDDYLMEKTVISSPE